MYNASAELPIQSFFDSDAGMFVAKAKAYLEGAKTLCSEMSRTRNRLLFSPTLHLAAHGAELLLKGSLMHNGVPKKEAISYGHELNKIWVLPQVETVRAVCALNARITHADAVAGADFPDAHTVTDPVALFNSYLEEIGSLHGERTKFPLRYPTESRRKAPMAPLIVGTLWRTADDYVKRPSEFLISDE